MPTRRGWAAFAAGLTLWFGARLLGSTDLHMVAAGIIALPILAAVVVRWTRRPAQRSTGTCPRSGCSPGRG